MTASSLDAKSKIALGAAVAVLMAVVSLGAPCVWWASSISEKLESIRQNQIAGSARVEDLREGLNALSIRVKILECAGSEKKGG